MTWWPWLHRNLRADPNTSDMFVRDRAVFTRPSATMRPLTVVVDARLRERAAHDLKVRYLLELLAVAPVGAHLYADAGPPLWARRLVAGDTKVESADGWASLGPGEREGRPVVSYVKDGVPTVAVVLADDPGFLHLAHAPHSGASAERVRADATALLVAKTIRADLFVTDRQLFVTPESDFWWTTTVLTPEDALPVVGLYLRQQGRFVFAHAPALGEVPSRRDNSVMRPAGRFYWQAATTLLPAAAERRREVLQATLLQRVDQALRARDRLLAAESVPQTPETVDLIQNELDQVLLRLMAAFDAAARFTHQTLDLTGRARDAA